VVKKIEHSATEGANDKLSASLKQAREARRIATNFISEDAKILEQLVDRKLLTKDGNDIYRTPAKEEIVREFASNEPYQILPSRQVVPRATSDTYVEVAGRLMSAWSMYYSPNAIRSPEEYFRNVDLYFNVPALNAAINTKAQLSLGADYDIVCGDSEKEETEEKHIKQFFEDIKFDRAMRLKSRTHLSIYGNAYIVKQRVAEINTSEEQYGDSRKIEKLIMLQPERVKIFLDPITTKILYYVYLPPVITAAMIGNYTLYPKYKDRNATNQMISGIAVGFPEPFLIEPKDMIHLTQKAFTEYPFGLSDVKPIMDPLQARLDINILMPMIYKHYAKPMVHWTVAEKETGNLQRNRKQVNKDVNDMISLLENMEPTSDPVTSDVFKANPITGVNSNDFMTLLTDMDQQIFMATGVPETYFKPRGTTDRMIGEQDKVFIGMCESEKQDFAEQIRQELIIEEIDRAFGTDTGRKYPTMQFKEAFQQDENEKAQYIVQLVSMGIITEAEARKELGYVDTKDDEVETMFKNYEKDFDVDVPKIKEKIQKEKMEEMILQDDVGEKNENDK